MTSALSCVDVSSMMAVLTMAVLSRSFLTAGRRILPGVVARSGARSGVRLCAPLPPTVSVNPLLDASLPARVLAFYVIAPVAEPEAAVDRHRDFLTAREMSGRVYLSADGMNAQVSGLTAACAEYRDFVAAEFPSERLLFKEDPVDELAFPRLRVKHKALVPEMADGAAVDLADRGEDVAPEEWQRMLAERNTSNVRVLDVRNGYEWDVGRFDGAERPEGDTFAEFEPETFGLPSGGAEAAETPVMMYCTGGIRCEIFSAKLKQRGFKKVYKLQGGIQHYGNALAAGALGTAAPDDAAVADAADAADAAPDADAVADAPPDVADAPPKRRGTRLAAGWKGSLFVFDRRSTLRFGAKAGTEPIGRCFHCGGATEAFVNCCNIDCNKLHLVCAACLRERAGFCCEPCTEAPRRRPLLLDGDADLDLSKVVAFTQGAAPGAADPNRLSSFKPGSLPRKQYDADRHAGIGSDRHVLPGEEEAVSR